ncbi:MAG: polysaccharide lyase family 1 protein [Mangrovibacterium sp.]
MKRLRRLHQLKFLLSAAGFLLGMLSCSGESQESGTNRPENPSVRKQIAFPGAEGAGKYTAGGRGGTVYQVTNLNDSGEGSLRNGIQKNETRTIVFRVSGIIDLKSPLDIHYGNLTIAGQTAPGGGICLKGYPVHIKADNVIIRYLRFRLGDVNAVQDDAFSCRNRKNILVDHCSFSWATDEVASLYEMHHATIQWCMVAESLNHSVHEKGDHGYGGIWGGDTVSFHHNLFAHNLSRNPRFNGARYQVPWTDLVDFRNNVIYNWGDNSIYGGERGNHNLVNNYFKPGPATRKSVRNRVLNITTSEDYPYGHFYVSGNYMDGNSSVSADNWNGGVDTEAAVGEVKAGKAFFAEATPEQSALVAYEAVLNSAGASLVRDQVDTRIISEVRSGTATYTGRYSQRPGLIDSQEEVGGWPELASLPPPSDRDNDGMPDSWEEKNQLNAIDEADGNQYTLSDSYTNLEVYLNGLAPKTE